MKGSIIILFIFLLGVFFSYFEVLSLGEHDYSIYILYILMLLVGIKIGMNKEAFKVIKSMNYRVFLVPLCTIVGTLAGSFLVGLLLNDLSISEVLAVGAGFGYYSLSSILITQTKGELLGSIALLSNIFREIITLIFTPLCVKYFGKLTPISFAGATSMDTCLPIISKYCGEKYTIISIFHGIVVDFTVVFLVSFFLQF